MNCRDVTGFLADYVAGEMPDDLRMAFEAHLTRCANCRTYLSQYRATIEVTGAIAGRGPLPPVPEELVRAVRASLGRLGS